MGGPPLGAENVPYLMIHAATCGPQRRRLRDPEIAQSDRWSRAPKRKSLHLKRGSYSRYDHRAALEEAVVGRRMEEAVVVCSCPCYNTSHLFPSKGVQYRRIDLTTVGKMVRCVSVLGPSIIDWVVEQSMAYQYVSSKDVMEKGIITCGSTGCKH